MSDILTTLISDYGQIAIFVLSALESACIPIPSELVVAPAGVLAYNGLLSIWGVIISATLGNVAGGWVAYAIGRRGGRPLVERYGRYVFLNERHLKMAEDWFQRHGEITVFVARLLPAFRTFISVPAGVGEMPLIRFLIYSLLGSLPWNVGLALAGYLLGAHWEIIEAYLKPISYVAAAAMVIIVIWLWIVARRARR